MAGTTCNQVWTGLKLCCVYRDGPSQLVTLADDNVWQLDSSCVNIPSALQQLMQETEASNIVPGQNCGGVFSQPGRPEMPKGTSCQDLHSSSTLSVSQNLNIVAVPARKCTV